MSAVCVLQTKTFENDVKRIDGSLKKELKRVLAKIIAQLQQGKLLKHLHNIFSNALGAFV